MYHFIKYICTDNRYQFKLFRDNTFILFIYNELDKSRALP